MKIGQTFLAAVVLALTLVGCGDSENSNADLNEAWPDRLSPDSFQFDPDPTYEKTFADLPLKGKSESLPWVSNYWPDSLGSIAYRWNKEQPQDGFLYPLHSERQVKRMSKKDLATLSPLEKFEIYLGNFDYPEIQTIRNNLDPDVPDWWGLCGGVALTGSVLAEPGPVTMRGPSGIRVPFGSSDIKALLAYYYDRSGSYELQKLGSMCTEEKDDCHDLNAGAFHIILTNEVGLRHKTIIGDLDESQATWNHVVFGYQSTLGNDRINLNSNAAPTAVREVLVETLVYRTEIAADSWQKIPLKDYHSISRLQYWLEIDSNDQIVGGSWVSEFYPDWLWRAKVGPIQGYFEELDTIYKASINNN